jgi:hypothetical protein
LLLWEFRHGKLPVDYGEEKSSTDPADYDIDLFKRILIEAKRSISAGGGHLVFVYLPEYERFRKDIPSPPWSAAGIKSEILNMVSGLGIDVIDIAPAFNREEDPLGLFPFRIKGHYNSKGYAVVANEIKRYLDGRQF